MKIIGEERNPFLADTILEGLNLSHDYFLIFNIDLRLISYNKATMKTLKNESFAQDILGKDIFYHIPEFKELWPIDYFIHNSNSTSHDISLDKEYLIKSPPSKESIFTQLSLHVRPDYVIVAGHDITGLKIANEESQKLKNTLEILTGLMKENENEIEKNCYYNLAELFSPLLDMLNLNEYNNERATKIVELLKENLNRVYEPLIQVLHEKGHFSSREVEIANLILLGQTSKEIADLLNVTCKTVDYHRANIRKKLSINNSSEELRSYLLAMSKNLSVRPVSLFCKREN